MRLTRIQLRNFRLLRERELLLAPSANWILGPNAIGKTTLLEALFLLSTGRSFRTRDLREIISHGSSFFSIEAHFLQGGVEQRLFLSFDGEEKRALLNDTPLPSWNALLGLIPAILMVPRDISLIEGAPAERRRMLDLFLSQLDPTYLHQLARYQKALAQRNSLLRTGASGSALLSILLPWEEILASSGSYLMQRRKKLISRWSSASALHMLDLSAGADQMELRYKSQWPETLEGLMHCYREEETREREAGHTKVGPHRDDLEMLVQGMLAHRFCSEGQKRCLLVALRLAQADEMRELLGDQIEGGPIFAIDDFDSHLDGVRLEILQHKLAKVGQLLLTSPSLMAPPALALEVAAHRLS